MGRTFRKGAVGALMDEYERAAGDLKSVLNSINQMDFAAIIDPETKDPDCRSVRTIANHVVRAGYGYANYIRKQFGEPFVERKTDYNLENSKDACREINNMLKYTEETLSNKLDISLDDVMENKIKTDWGQDYDLEQMLEHAIVHILRHRRQIERFINRE